MSAVDFIKSDDTSNVVFINAEAAEGDDAVVRGVEHRFKGSTYVSVPNVKGFVKVAASKASTRRKGAGQPSNSEIIDLSDDVEILNMWQFQLRGRKESYRW
ncbi:hypothetical protein Hdeb2414_s0002g00057421 [Helianthus debilis subsp. tardiflorus]